MTPITMLSGHRGYVVSTWARGQRYPLRIQPAFRFVNRVLDSGADVVVLADETHTTVHAWACASDGTLHYAYVPPELRAKGLARRLITALFGGYPDHVNVTHRWPFESPRYRHTPHLLLRAAA